MARSALLPVDKLEGKHGVGEEEGGEAHEDEDIPPHEAALKPKPLLDELGHSQAGVVLQQSRIMLRKKGEFSGRQQNGGTCRVVLSNE